MYNKEKLNNVEMKIFYMKEKTQSKRLMSVEEKEEAKGKIISIAEIMTEILNDNEIELDIKKQLASKTRNQKALINKILDSLERVINKARENIE